MDKTNNLTKCALHYMILKLCKKYLIFLIFYSFKNVKHEMQTSGFQVRLFSA